MLLRPAPPLNDSILKTEKIQSNNNKLIYKFRHKGRELPQNKTPINICSFVKFDLLCQAAHHLVGYVIILTLQSNDWW
jgi:hypothetical protein